MEVGTDTYVTVAEADTYFGARYGFDAWAILTDTNKEKALVSATQQLDLLCIWFGDKVDSEQALEFPRNYSEVDADPVPQAVKDAQCEIASAISINESASTSADDALTELKAGTVTLKFDGNSATEPNPIINGLTTKLLRPYGLCCGAGKVSMVLQ